MTQVMTFLYIHQSCLHFPENDDISVDMRPGPPVHQPGFVVFCRFLSTIVGKFPSPMHYSLFKTERGDGKMNNKTRLPPAYLRAKLNIINLQLDQIPPIVHGRHRGQEVLRQYQVVNGKRRIVETMATSRDGLDWSCKMNLRKDLIKIKKQLENMLIYEPDTKLVNTDKVKTIYNKQYWDKVRVRADFETKIS